MARLRRIILCLALLAAVSSACSVTFTGRAPTPVPTISFPTPIVPTLTPTPEPTIVPTFPPKIEMTNERYDVALLEDGGTLFVDKQIGYLMEFGPEWLIVPIDASTHGGYSALVQATMSDEAALWLNEFFNQGDFMRMVALDYTLAYSEGEDVIANFTISYVEDDWTRNTDLNDVLLYQAAYMPTLIQDAIVYDQAILTNANGIQYGRMVINNPANANGQPVKQVMMMVKMGEGVLLFTGTVRDNLLPMVEPVFQQMMDTLVIAG